MYIEIFHKSEYNINITFIFTTFQLVIQSIKKIISLASKSQIHTLCSKIGKIINHIKNIY